MYDDQRSRNRHRQKLVGRILSLVHTVFISHYQGPFSAPQSSLWIYHAKINPSAACQSDLILRASSTTSFHSKVFDKRASIIELMSVYRLYSYPLSSIQSKRSKKRKGNIGRPINKAIDWREVVVWKDD